METKPHSFLFPFVSRYIHVFSQPLKGKELGGLVDAAEKLTKKEWQRHVLGVQVLS